MKHFLSSSALGLVILASPALAEFELSAYGGYQTSPHSTVTGMRADSTPFDVTIGWDGKSFEAPPYYGLRGMYWRDSGIGYGVEFTHAKVYAPADEMPDGFTRLEFTDGHNIITANIMKRWSGQWAQGRLTPYVGAGVGIAVPHVDATENGNVTFGYQYTGPAVRALAGVHYRLNDRWGLFTEYQITYSQNEADLEGGGTLETDLVTNALNFGVTFGF